jgi:N-acetylmuramoyl-L-alanine amidase
MEKKRIIIISAFLLLSSLQVLAQAPEVKPNGITILLRYQSYPAYTRIVLEGDEETLKETKVLRMDSGLQFSIEFKKKPSLIKPETLSINDGLVKAVELIEKGDKKILNILLEKAPHDYKSFLLKEPPRRVIDLYKVPVTTSVPRTVIVIDPGHGGTDAGAKGISGLKEKVLTLDMALRLKTLLQKIPEIKVVLTRSSDIAVPLRERAFIGNSNKADLFVSLHGNSSFGKSSKGFILYVLPPHEPKTEENRNPYLWDIQHMRSLKESKRLAESLKETLEKELGENIMIKEAPILGLMGVEAPSVLLEIPMVAEEEKKLQKDSYKNKIASNIMDGIFNFFKRKPETGRPEGETTRQ